MEIGSTEILISCASGRPTEIAENDTYICESLYEESRRQIKKLARDGLKKYTHQTGVVQDEIYFFRRPIQPQRVQCRSPGFLFFLSFCIESHVVFCSSRRVLFFSS